MSEGTEVLEIGFYYCPNCKAGYLSNLALENVNCLSCQGFIELSQAIKVTGKEYEEIRKGFSELLDYYDHHEVKLFYFSSFEADKIKSYVGSKASACWGNGKIGKSGLYQLALFSPVHYGDKQTLFFTTNKNVEEVTQ